MPHVYLSPFKDGETKVPMFSATYTESTKQCVGEIRMKFSYLALDTVLLSTVLYNITKHLILKSLKERLSMIGLLTFLI
jgi:hypothetical protein